MRLSVDGWVKKLLFHAYAPLGWARAPNHVSLDLTRRCNLRCRMCFYYGGEARDAHGLDELSSLEIISRVVNRLEGADYDLTGGEPLVRDDLPEILSAIRDRGARCSLTTNGTLMTAELARRAVGEELLAGAHFSLHGLKDTHEEITRVRNSFDRTLKGIQLLLAERARRGAIRPEVTIACTVTGANMKHAGEMIRLTREIGADRVSFGHASFMPPGVQAAHRQFMERKGLAPDPGYDDLVQGPPEIPAAGEDLESYVESLARARRSPEKERVGTSPEEYGGEEIRRHYLDLNWKYKSACAYPWRNLRVGPDGTVTPCVGYIIGNVRDEDVRGLWNHARFRKFRSALYRSRLFPGCLRCCKLK
jgi:MoaA/NifB/PqqE/SkfB family radical SAM enzyme